MVFVTFIIAATEIFMQMSKRFGLNPFSFNEESFYYLAYIRDLFEEFPEMDNVDVMSSLTLLTKEHLCVDSNRTIKKN